MENMKQLGNKALEKQRKKNEGEMFKITDNQFEQDREQFEYLSEDDKIFVNKYFKILDAIYAIEEDIERVVARDGSAGQINIQTNQREKFRMVKNEMNEELKIKPHLVDFIYYHEEKVKLRNPENPSLN